MSKPPGLGLSVSGNDLRFTIQTASKTEDAIWEAVGIAIDEGWTPENFKLEAWSAWEQRIRDDAKTRVHEANRAFGRDR